MGEKRHAYRILVGKPEGKRPLGRPRSRWADNIKMYLREIGWDGMEWIGLMIRRMLSAYFPKKLPTDQFCNECTVCFCEVEAEVLNTVHMNCMGARGSAVG
jgi:hypothetical protein